MGLIALIYVHFTALAVAQSPLCIDPSFQAPFTHGVISDIDFMSNGQILVAGHIRRPAGPAIAYIGRSRLNPDGSIDESFDQNIGPNSGGVRIWNEETFFATAGALGVSRCFMSSGTPDPTYGLVYPQFSTSQRFDYHIFETEKQWRTGWYIKRILDDEGNQIGSIPGYGLLQVLPDGTTDPDFDHKYTAPGWLTSIHQTPDGRFLLGSAAGVTQYEGQSVGGILRVWPDGALDTTFHTSIFWGQSSPHYYHYPDGRFLAFGQFQVPEYPGDTLGILRLHSDGTTDTSWPTISFRNPQYFFPGLAQVTDFLEIEPGKLIIVGEFVEVEGQAAGGIAVIDTSGNVHWDYFTGTDAGEIQQSENSTERYLRGIKQGPDGSIYIYGAYHGFDDGCSNHPDQRLITKLYPLNVGVNGSTSSDPLHIYPNPTNGIFQLTFPSGSQLLELKIFDMTGRSTLAQNGSEVSNGLSVDLTDRANGIYLVQAKFADGTRFNERIIKE